MYVTLLALQTLVVLTLDGTAQDVRWLNSARWLPYLLFGPVVGALVDRRRRRSVMVATDLAQAVLFISIPVVWAGLLSLPLLLVIVMGYGTASLINGAASMSVIPASWPPSTFNVHTHASTVPTRSPRPPARLCRDCW